MVAIPHVVIGIISPSWIEKCSSQTWALGLNKGTIFCSWPMTVVRSVPLCWLQCGHANAKLFKSLFPPCLVAIIWSMWKGRKESSSLARQYSHEWVALNAT